MDSINKYIMKTINNKYFKMNNLKLNIPIIKIIIDEINKNYNKLFNYHNRKYSLEELLKWAM